MAIRERLDNALVARGLAPSRSQARDLILRGCVTVDGKTAQKAGLEVGAESGISVTEGAQPYVSRGGLKLAAALDAFGFDASGLRVLDVGASTGGFVDVLLRRGAARVYAVDVGRGQLHASLVVDPRVVSIEDQDIRTLSLGKIDGPVGAVTADVSFIPLSQALGPALALTTPRAWVVALIKPQFEVGREDIGKGGIVRDDAARLRAVETVKAWLAAQSGWRVIGTIDSPIAGGSGNAEFLLGAQRDD